MLLHSDTLCWFWACRHVHVYRLRPNIMYPSGATCLQAQNQHNVSEWCNISTGSEPTCCSTRIHYVGSEPVDMLLHSDTLCWFWACRYVAPFGMYPSGATCLQPQNEHIVSEVEQHVNRLRTNIMYPSGATCLRCSTSDTICSFWGCRHVAPLGYIMLVLSL
jgi:LSD1 subclass zinc finger protein